MSKVSRHITQNAQWFLERLEDTDLQVVYDHLWMQKKKISILWIWLESSVNAGELQRRVFEPLTREPFIHQHSIWDAIRQRLPIKQAQLSSSLVELEHKLLKGHVLLCVEGATDALSMPVQSMLQRGIEEPPSETTVRGAHEGFVESLETNASLLRKRLPSPDLCMESFILGSQIPSELKMFYLRSRAEPSLLEEVRSRLQKLQTKDVLSSGEVEQWIEDAPWSVFPTIGNTEKPDKAAAQILEGRVVLLLDGDPTALFMPHLFIESILNTEDYTSRPYYVSFIRLLRTMSYFFSILLPAYYIAMLNFHKEMIPTALLPKLQESSAKAPFPITLEILIMILMFEIVREAGIRLPKSVGSAVSIVGALILGQVSVDSGIVSPPTIIVVAFSAITGFTLTPVADVIALLRIANIIVASFLGLYGVILFMLGVLVHVVSLTSFHSPFLSPIAPLYLQDWKDGFVKFPIRWLSRNPRSLHDRQRVGWKK